jgi:hypothetical protein
LAHIYPLSIAAQTPFMIIFFSAMMRLRFRQNAPELLANCIMHGNDNDAAAPASNECSQPTKARVKNILAING